MKNPRRKFEMFCLRNRTKGIPNLMLYIVLGNAIVYLMSAFSGNYFLYNLLYFDRGLILRGQVWRLITYPLTYNAGNLLLTAVALLCYYSLGRAMESMWGTLKFNLFYAAARNSRRFTAVPGKILNLFVFHRRNYHIFCQFFIGKERGQILKRASG